MEESPSRNNVRRVTPMEKKPPKPKAPPPPKPKPSRLSTNKVNSDPNSSPPKRTNVTNTNGIRGANVHRLSSVFEDKNGPKPNFKPLMAPSLPLSPKLPVPTVAINSKRPKAEKKSVKSSTTTTTTTKISTETEVDESPLKYGDIKAKFEQAEASDVAVN